METGNGFLSFLEGENANEEEPGQFSPSPKLFFFYMHLSLKTIQDLFYIRLKSMKTGSVWEAHPKREDASMINTRTWAVILWTP